MLGLPTSSDKKTILFVSPFKVPLSGADESLLVALSGLNKLPVQSIVVTPPSAPYLAKYRKYASHVKAIPMVRLARTFNPLHWLAYILSQPVEVFRFWRLMRRHKIDLLHSNMEAVLSPALAARLLGIPIVYHYRGKTRDDPKWFFSLFLPLINSLADHIFVISQMTAEGFFHRNLGAKVEVLYNAVDLDRFHAKPEQYDFASESPLLEGLPVVLFVGRLTPQKRVHLLIEAIQSLRAQGEKVGCAIVGCSDESALEKEYEALLHHKVQKNEPLVFLGERQDIPRLMRASAAVALPSVNEGFGRVLVEAMACGVPVIGARSGAIPEGRRWGDYDRLHEADNVDALAQKIREALQDKTSRTKEAQTYVQSSHSAQAYGKKLMATYQTLWDKTSS